MVPNNAMLIETKKTHLVECQREGKDQGSLAGCSVMGQPVRCQKEMIPQGSNPRRSLLSRSNSMHKFKLPGKPSVSTRRRVRSVGDRASATKLALRDHSDSKIESNAGSGEVENHQERRNQGKMAGCSSQGQSVICQGEVTSQKMISKRTALSRSNSMQKFKLPGKPSFTTPRRVRSVGDKTPVTTSLFGGHSGSKLESNDSSAEGGNQQDGKNQGAMAGCTIEGRFEGIQEETKSQESNPRSLLARKPSMRELKLPVKPSVSIRRRVRSLGDLASVAVAPLHDHCGSKVESNAALETVLGSRPKMTSHDLQANVFQEDNPPIKQKSFRKIASMSTGVASKGRKPLECLDVASKQVQKSKQKSVVVTPQIMADTNQDYTCYHPKKISVEIVLVVSNLLLAVVFQQPWTLQGILYVCTYKILQTIWKWYNYFSSQPEAIKGAMFRRRVSKRFRLEVEKLFNGDTGRLAVVGYCFFTEAPAADGPTFSASSIRSMTSQANNACLMQVIERQGKN